MKISLSAFILGKGAVYFDGRLYFDIADRDSIRGTPNYFEIDFEEKEIVFSRWRTTKPVADRRLPMNLEIEASGDVGVFDGYPPAYGENRLTTRNYQPITTIQALVLGKRLKMFLIDNKIVGDNHGILSKKAGDPAGTYSKKPSIVMIDDPLVRATNGDPMAVITFYNDDVWSALPIPQTAKLWNRGQLVFFSTEDGQLP